MDLRTEKKKREGKRADKAAEQRRHISPRHSHHFHDLDGTGVVEGDRQPETQARLGVERQRSACRLMP